MTQRAPADLRPKLLQVQHHAMKGDMEVQMSRIAKGLEMERPLITHFKSKALDKALTATKHSTLPMAANTLETVRSMRLDADTLREETFHKLAEVAQQREQSSTSGGKANRMARVFGRVGLLGGWSRLSQAQQAPPPKTPQASAKGR